MKTVDNFVMYIFQLVIHKCHTGEGEHSNIQSELHYLSMGFLWKHSESNRKI